MRRPDRTPGSPDEWLAHAQSDLRLAQLARQDADVLPVQACFHAQQATEKAIKAVLLSKAIEFPLVHDIETLLELAQRGGLSLPPLLREADALTPYAVETRYPGQLEAVSRADVDHAIRIAEVALQWAAELSSKP